MNELVIILVVFAIGHILTLTHASEVNAEREEYARLELHAKKCFIEYKVQQKQIDFDKYVAYIDSLEQQLDEIGDSLPTTQQVQRLVRTSLDNGVDELYKSNRAYRHYKRVSPHENIRECLREFTVGQIVNTFYL